jgi:iron complex outermembrane receptor protein
LLAVIAGTPRTVAPVDLNDHAPLSSHVSRAAPQHLQPSAADPDSAATLRGIVDTLEVVADRPQPLETLSTFAVAHDVELSAGVATVADIVESGVGVRVRRYGGLGAYSTASIRASDPGQVEIYMDGVPLVSGQWGVVNLADVPVDGLERVEVYRSGAPARFGTPGIGGVVNLVTRPAGVGRSFAAVTAGSHDTWKAELLHSGSARGFGYVASFDYLQSRGDFEYLDRRGTPLNPDDDAVVARQNNDFRQFDLMLRLSAPPWRGWRVELADGVFRKESGIPGIENVHTKSVRYEIFRNTARASLISPSLGDALELSLSCFHQHRRDLFSNPDDEAGYNRSDTDDLARAYGVNGLATVHWRAARQIVGIFAEARRERFTPTDENPAIGEGFTRRRSAVSLSAEDRLLVGNSLELTAGYRLQESADNYTGPIPFGQPPAPRDDPHRSAFHGPSFGVRWRPHPLVTVRANRTRYARFPSMMELFGAIGTVQGNSELSPEEGATEDLGVTFELRGAGDAGEVSGSGAGVAATALLRHARIEAVYFRSQRENLITFIQNSQRTVKAVNLESAAVEGLELSASASLGGRDRRFGLLNLTVAYTWQDARNTGPSPVYNGKRLPYEPEHSLFLRTELARRRVRVWHEYRFESESYRDRANLPENVTPARHIHDAGVALVLLRGVLTLRAEVANLTDERMADVEGYPLAGRTYTVGIEVSQDWREDN